MMEVMVSQARIWMIGFDDKLPFRKIVYHERFSGHRGETVLAIFSGPTGISH